MLNWLALKFTKKRDGRRQDHEVAEQDPRDEQERDRDQQRRGDPPLGRTAAPGR